MKSSTIVCKAQLDIADIDRHYYRSHQITLAHESSETARKNMAMLVAYICNANDQLKYRQQQNKNQPELWKQSPDTELDLWIDTGQPELKRIKTACNQSKKVIIYSYGQTPTKVWWNKNKNKLSRYKNLQVYTVNTENLDTMKNRRMKLSCTLEDGEILINDGNHNVSIERHKLM